MKKISLSFLILAITCWLITWYMITTNTEVQRETFQEFAAKFTMVGCFLFPALSIIFLIFHYGPKYLLYRKMKDEEEDD